MGGGQTPLHLAAANGNLEASRALLAAGADVNAVVGLQDSTSDSWFSWPITAVPGSTPLHMAALASGSGCNDCKNAAGLPGVVSSLLEAGADINAKDCEGYTALERAWDYNAKGYYKEDVGKELVSLLEAAAASTSEA